MVEFVEQPGAAVGLRVEELMGDDGEAVEVERLGETDAFWWWW